jgi:mannitol/fructose-specific phosphotransferase system IIA component (Ntr-type)
MAIGLVSHERPMETALPRRRPGAAARTPPTFRPQPDGGDVPAPRERSGGMRTVEVIERGGILLRPLCRTFEDSVGALVDALIANQRLPAALRERAVRSVCEREAMASTAIVEIGVSVPHARLDGVAGVVAALAAAPSALYYAMTGVPISIMVLVFSAPELVGEHLDTLAGISMLLQSAALRRGLEHAIDAPAALRILRGENGHAR